MKTIEMNGVKYTTISEVARKLCDGNKDIYKKVRQFVSQQFYGNYLLEKKDFIKLHGEKIDELGELKPIGKPPKSIILVDVESVPKIEEKIIFNIKRLQQNEYKVDRFIGKKRNAYDELVYSLDHHDKKVEKNLFKAVLSSMNMLENIGATKEKSIKHAAGKYAVKQTEIKEILDLVQHEMKAKDKAQKNYGNRNKNEFITNEKARKINA